MTKAEAKKRIAKLRKVINHHNYLYHVLDKPEISDAAFDSLKYELYKLEQQYRDLITLDSPTQRVSGKALDKFVKVKHKKRMLSLEDVFYLEEFQAWRERIQKLVPRQKLDYFAELKIDGFAITLVYKNGIFVQGATRGDGRIGEDVSQNLKTIASIPLKLEIHQKLPSKVIERKVKPLLAKGEIEVRGEVYMTKKAFAKVNQERQKKDLPLYANPRNTAAGSIRQLDPKIAASRQLDFLAYDLVTNIGQQTHQQEHQIARALGFKVDQGQYCSNSDEVIKFRQKINQNRGKLPYQIDGLVVSVNNNALFKKLGVVGKAPRGAIAFKFPAKEATTIVEDIVVQVGRTGALTPVARLRPVRIGGTLVTRATLHNEDEIKKLDVRLGDTVIVQRAGDVIPDVVKVIKKLRTGKEKKFQMPQRCPVCSSKVIRPKGEVVHRCANKKCGAQQRKRLIHFASRKAFDIEGLGPKIVEQLMDEGLISDPADFFSLKQGDLVPLERFAEKSAANLVEAIDQKKKISLAKFIYALGIRHVGEETAVNLAYYFGSLRELKKTSLEEFLRVKDIGEVVAQSVFEWFNNKVNQRFLNKLIKAGLQITKVKTVKKKLLGLTFILTGELDKFTREQAKEKIRHLGGNISSSVSKETDFVVVGREPGIKYNKAKKIGVKIIDEKEFLRMIK
ncbi:MAG: NAD-dependent DNA ligase LigA [Candidatus Portnoybacteria bacterium]|nr:NAD-dependent DNA ligase LigA [Candidatus Portnoybacteria bacterium]